MLVCLMNFIALEESTARRVVQSHAIDGGNPPLDDVTYQKCARVWTGGHVQANDPPALSFAC